MNLLEEAKRRYPNGTRVKSVINGSDYPYIKRKNPTHEWNFILQAGQLIGNIKPSTSGGVTLYKDGVWAEIINE